MRVSAFPDLAGVDLLLSGGCGMKMTLHHRADASLESRRALAPARRAGRAAAGAASILASVGEPRPGDYGRGGNATWTALEEALGAIEDA